MIFEKVKAIIVTELKCEEAQVVPEASFVDDIGVDSLDMVELSMALEEAFGVTIEDEMMAEMKTVNDLVAHLEKITK